MKNSLQNYWWSFTVRGIAAVLFSILAVFFTKFTLELLILLFGIFVLADGLIIIFYSIGTAKSHKDWWINLVRGLVGIILGLITLFWPGITGLIIGYMIAIWAIIIGLIELWIASKFPKEIEGKWILNASAILSLIIGVLILFFPGSGLVTITWMIGIFALILGVSLFTFGMQLKNK